ncbi:MAG TPA: nucleoside recognition domain-containing protein, partial [Kiritimatiellia bacterium]|nr:nucleoside recognition domain-containing protein [Kiritimatiellia bacterium]
TAAPRMAGAGASSLNRAGPLTLLFPLLLWPLAPFPRLDESHPPTRDLIHHAASAQGITPDHEAWEPFLAALAIEQSYLGRAGKTLQPLFDPAGFDWRITVGVLASFPAREVIIATLGILYTLGNDIDETSPDLRSALRDSLWTSGPRHGTPVFTLPTVFAIMVFFALCMQCGATLVTLAKESQPRWALFTFTYMTTLAWLAAVATYQLLSLLPSPS